MARRRLMGAVAVALLGGCSSGGHAAPTSHPPVRSTATSPASPSSPSATSQYGIPQNLDFAGAVKRALATSAKVTATVVDTENSATVSTVRMVGTFDFPAAKGVLDVTATGSLIGARQQVRELFTPKAVDLLTSDDIPGLPRGKYAVLPRAAAQPHFVMHTAANDPTAWLEELAGASYGSDLGPATVDGVATEHLNADLSTATARKYLGAVAREQLDKATVQPVFLAEAWVDSSGRLVRAALSAVDPSASGPPATKVQLDLSGYGTTVTVPVPVGQQAVMLTATTAVILG